MNLKFIATPRLGRLEQITRWLQEEREISGCGFYCNLTVIKKAFADKEVVCVTAKNEAIAFAVFTRHKYTATIEIAEVCPSYRGSGVGKFLIEGCLQALAKRDVRVVDLECEPKKSEGFWQHMGFCRIPDEVDENYSMFNKPIKMFCPTGQIQREQSTNDTSESLIELFDCKTWECEGREPRWSWPIFTINETELDKPIIHPANREWCVRWRNKDRIVKEDKVKHFCNDTHKWGSYLILTYLPPTQ